MIHDSIKCGEGCSGLNTSLGGAKSFNELEPSAALPRLEEWLAHRRRFLWKNPFVGKLLQGLPGIPSKRDLAAKQLTHTYVSLTWRSRTMDRSPAEPFEPTTAGVSRMRRLELLRPNVTETGEDLWRPHDGNFSARVLGSMRACGRLWTLTQNLWMT